MIINKCKCGGNAKIVRFGTVGFFVYCSVCNTVNSELQGFGVFKDEDDAIKSWNYNDGGLDIPDGIKEKSSQARFDAILLENAMARNPERFKKDGEIVRDIMSEAKKNYNNKQGEKNE